MRDVMITMAAVSQDLNTCTKASEAGSDEMQSHTGLASALLAGIRNRWGFVPQLQELLVFYHLDVRSTG